MKTRADVQALKENWLNDPCWDIENTDGFEEYREDLYTFRLLQENAWKKEREARLRVKVLGWGCSLDLVRYIEKLENRIEKLEKKVFNG